MQKTSTVTVPFMLLGILFNICLVASNLLETKVIQVFGITATAGLIVFPISYIINDCIAEVWGFKKARLIIWSGFDDLFPDRFRRTDTDRRTFHYDRDTGGSEIPL